MRSIKDRIWAAVRLHEQQVARLARSGGIAILVLDPRGVAETAREAGWDGKTNPALLRMNDDFRMWLATTDAVTAAWLSRNPLAVPAGKDPTARILVLTGDGSLLLNFTPEEGDSF